MAIALMSSIMDCKCLSATEKLVALCLADQANDEGICQWRTLRFIIYRTSLTERTIFRTFKMLEDKHFLMREEEKLSTGGRKATKYRLNCDIIASNAVKYSSAANESLTYSQYITDPMAGTPLPYDQYVTDRMSPPPAIRSGGGDIMSVSPTPSNIDLPLPTPLPTPPPLLKSEEEKIKLEERKKLLAHPDFTRVFQKGCDLFTKLQFNHPTAILLWLDQGIDADLDIIPAFEARAARGKPEGVNKWVYFTSFVQEAYAMRQAGLPPIDIEKHLKKKPNSQKLFSEMAREKTKEAIKEMDRKYGIIST